MGVFKRYKDAQAAQKNAENAMPGAYQSNYTDRINEALDSMGAASNAGYDVGTDSELYRQYRAGAQANARAAAENAAAGAAALSGGYGSSYANSVAQQGYQQAMANVDSGLAGLRDKALTLYQLKQNGLSGLLSALQNQDSLEAAEHQGAVANAQDWRDYKKSRADQAAQEKSDFLSNLWEMAKSVGRAGLTAYDTYKGYTQQQWENEFAREQWEYNKERTGQSDALNAYEQAFNLYQQGAGDAANAVLGRYGLDSGSKGQRGKGSERCRSRGSRPRCPVGNGCGQFCRRGKEDSSGHPGLLRRRTGSRDRHAARLHRRLLPQL